MIKEAVCSNCPLKQMKYHERKEEYFYSSSFAAVWPFVQRRMCFQKKLLTFSTFFL